MDAKQVGDVVHLNADLLRPFGARRIAQRRDETGQHLPQFGVFGEEGFDASAGGGNGRDQGGVENLVLGRHVGGELGFEKGEKARKRRFHVGRKATTTPRAEEPGFQLADLPKDVGVILPQAFEEFRGAARLVIASGCHDEEYRGIERARV